MENTTPTIQLSVDAPLNVHFNEETKALTLTCYQFLSQGMQGLKMDLKFSPQATQQMLRALEYLQTEFGVSSEQLEMPHSVQ